MKRKFMRGIAALVLAALIMPGTVSMAAESDALGTGYGIATVSSGDTEGAGDAGNTGEAGDKIQLDAPTKLMWSSWIAAWMNGGLPSGDDYYYQLEVYKDGELFLNPIIHTRMESYGYPVHLRIEESGVYKFRVASINQGDPEHLIDSAFSEFSEEKVYVRPEQELGTTVGWWDEEVPGLIHFNPVEGAADYQIALYYNGERKTATSPRLNMDGTVQTEYDFSKRIAEYGEGKYYVTIRAISSKIDKIYHGVEGEPSPVYDTSKTAEQISEIISQAVAGGSAADALKTIMDNLTKEQLQMAMQTDAGALNQIAELEQRMAQEKGIEVKDAALSQEAEKLVDQSKISVVGAALSAEPGSVGLEVSVPQENVDVSANNYAKSVQLDIKLVNNSAEIHDLTAPITVTMPLPDGITAKKLIIRHYSADGSSEAVTPKMNDDGTITFTVTHFSTFVFANEKDGAGPENTGDNSGNDDNDGDNNVNNDESKTGTPEAKKSPKTGEEGFPAALPIMAVMVLGAAVTFRKGLYIYKR